MDELKIEGGRLFNFQRRAAEFCVTQLRAGRPCVLAIGTGCGKTLTLREVVILLGRPRTLLLAPGGICRQLAQAINEPPWARRQVLRPEDRVDAVFAETGRQLIAAVDARRHGVVVANAKVRNLREVLEWPELVVVDEAHLATLSLLRALRSRCLVLSTATPFELPVIRRFFATLRLDARNHCFTFAKTPEVMQALGTATLEITPTWSDEPNPVDYFRRLVGRLMAHGSRSISVVMCLLAVAAVARDVHPDALECVLRALGQELGGAVHDAGIYSLGGRAFFHDASAAHALAQRLVASRLAAVDREGRVLAELEPRLRSCVDRSAELERRAVGAGELPGFGLTPAEYEHLFGSHLCVTVRDRHWSEDAAFSTALVRVPHATVAREAARVRERHPKVKVFELHTGMSASQRALTIRRFASHDGDRANAKFFVEGLRRHGSGAAKAALSLGGGWVPLQIYRCLARPRLLVADDTVDVGWELHRHVDTIILPHLLPDRTKLLQLIGRVSRIAVDRTDQGSTAVRISLSRGTLDGLFQRRLREDVVPVDDEEPGARSRVLNEEMTSALMNLAESELQRAWLQHVISGARHKAR